MSVSQPADALDLRLHHFLPEGIQSRSLWLDSTMELQIDLTVKPLGERLRVTEEGLWVDGLPATFPVALQALQSRAFTQLGLQPMLDAEREKAATAAAEAKRQVLGELRAKLGWMVNDPEDRRRTAQLLDELSAEDG